MAALMSYFILKINLLLLVFIVRSLIECSQQDIVGCGGFLKSSVSLDLSKVEIKLYTKQGTLKESSDCAPTNGYYFLPVYDKGDYILKVQPPEDWFFEPREIHLNFDGVNDPCSKAKDINIFFKGFRIKGKVISAGTTSGPENVMVTLLSESDNSVKLVTTTRSEGQYEFSPIFPGQYLVTAFKENLKFSKGSVKVHIKENNLSVPDGSLVVSGYNVTGQVFFNGDPTVGVNFVLFSNDERNRHLNLEGCSKAPLANSKHTDYVCHVASDEKGVFQYKTVPPGNYTIRPHYNKFDVQPKKIIVVVKHEHISLSEKFLVKGFSVSGRVLKSPEGAGIKNAEIYLNRKKVATTDEEGKYTLDSIEPGKYNLLVRSENVKFNELTVKLSPNTLEVENIYPSKFKVCGLVTSVSDQQPRIVEIQNVAKTEEIIEAKVDRETEKFCLFLKPGIYNFAVKLSNFEKSSGMQYLPAVKKVHVRNSPISDIEFTQLRGNIYGKVITLPEITKAVELSVKLKMKNSLVALKILEGNDLSYNFKQVMPGFYDVEVEKHLWCFQKEVYTVSVTSSETLVPDFVQTGFKVKIKSSHQTSVIIKNGTSENEFNKELVLEKGDNSFCLPHSSLYTLQPVGCHGYEKYVFTIDPKQGSLVTLNAVSHDVTGFVKSVDFEKDLAVNVVLSSGLSTRLTLSKGEKTSSGVIYRFSYRTHENRILKFVPLSNTLLFQPEFIEYRTTEDCANDVIQFSCEKGLIIEGRVEPPLNNVKVTLKFKGDHPGQDEIHFLTEEDGKYKFGPLRSTLSFEITAAKESYVFSGPDKNGNFIAHKLAEINVKVIDNATKNPLQGVLLSLTGGEKYRKNSMTAEQGSLSFNSLSPGEYFLKPMMKEYKFDPSSQIIQIKEGVTESIELRGRRVSFSAYGVITSLNGEPESNVVVEASGLHTCSNLLEEASSEANGQFRIRGLLPQCEYQIRLKNESTINVRIHRLEPPHLLVQTNKGDVRGLELIVFHMIEQMDLSVHVESTIPEHLKTLKLKLFKESEPDSPVFAVKLDTLAGGAKHWGNQLSQERFLKAGLLVQLPFIPRDKSSYFIQIESSLNKHTYNYKETTVHFVADRTFKNFKMYFEPTLKALDHELSQSKYIVVSLLIFALIFYTYFNKAVPAMQNFFGSFNQTSFTFAREERNIYSHNNIMDNVSIEPVLVPTKRKTKPRKA